MVRSFSVNEVTFHVYVRLETLDSEPGTILTSIGSSLDSNKRCLFVSEIVELLEVSFDLSIFKYFVGTTIGSLNATKIYPLLFIVLMSIDNGLFFFSVSL